MRTVANGRESSTGVRESANLIGANVKQLTEHRHLNGKRLVALDKMKGRLVGLSGYQPSFANAIRLIVKRISDRVPSGHSE